MKIFVTGAAGFIGFHLCKRLLEDSHQVIGLDNLSDYYDVELKKERIRILNESAGFEFIEEDLADLKALEVIFQNHSFPVVINLAAQAGVRYSLENPHAYVHSNLTGFMNVLEVCRKYKVKHLIYASSSSVYGANGNKPFSTKDNVDHPVSIYAATKKANELMAHTYSHLYKLPTTGLRFFTVYGPWGRPDMAYYSFTKDIFEGQPIKVYNYGNMKRDFTYIDDIVEGMVQLISRPPEETDDWDRTNPDPGSSYAPYKVYNIGNHQPVNLMDFIHLLETLIGKKAIIELLPMQPGDVKETFADISGLQEAVGFYPATPLEIGLARFVEWYKQYHSKEK